MLFRNTENQFGWISIFLHWIMAILIIGMLILGLYMTRIPISLLKLKLYGLHKEIGALILFLFFVRVTWRFINTLPSLADIPAWERWSARAMHFALYGFMCLLPVTGWLLTSSAGLPVSFFGLFTLPNLVPANPNVQAIMTTIHHWLAYFLIGAIALHGAAALKHHFIDKDSILRRILWP